MFKRKGIGKRIVALALTAAMGITLLPQMQFTASGVSVNGYPIYNEIIYDAIEDKIKNAAYPSRDTVYGGIGSWFYWDDSNRTDMTHVYHNSRFLSSRVNLRPSVSVISADSNAWKAVFKEELKNYRYITKNPDVSLLFGATFISTKNKPSMTLDGVTIGGSSLSKKSTKAVEGTATYPFEDLDVTVQGASGTEVSNMWVVAMDNTSAKYANISAEMSGDRGLLLHIQMDEELRWANDAADQYIDDMYIEIKLMDSLTGIESASKKAGFYELNGDTITFRCSNAELGEYTQKDFLLTRISKVNIPVISDIDFEVYGVRACFDYQSGYDSNTRRETYTSVGNPIAYLQDVKLDTTPITDLAGNKVELGTENLTGKNIRFDNVDPTIIKTVIGGNKVSGGNISREDLFLGKGQSLDFSVVFSELVELSGTVTAKLNVADKDGNQVVLQQKSVGTSKGVYSENNSTVLNFQTFTAVEGMKMMEGHENESIQILSLTGTYRDQAGNSLTGTMPAADKEIALDVAAPAITVQKLASEDNSPVLEFRVKVDDSAVGILGEYAAMQLKAGASSDMRYDYEVFATDDTLLANGNGTMSGENAGTIRWKLHNQNSYEAIVKITFTNTDGKTINNVSAQVSAADILDNQNTGEFTEYAFVVDKEAPVITIDPVEYSYTSTETSFEVTFEAEDFSKVTSLQYQWTELDAESPDNSWETVSITAGKNVIHTLSETKDESISKKLWVRAGDFYEQFATASIDVVANIERPAIHYDTTAIIDGPDPDPVLKVIAADKKSTSASTNAGSNAYTRITVQMGTNCYVRLVKTGDDPVNVFDFSGTWYKVKLNAAGTGYEEVSVADVNEIESYYGEVYVSFEAAYAASDADFTPAAGNNFDANVNDGSYVKENGSIKVLYAPVNADPKAVHEVSFDEVMDAAGSEILAENGSAGQQAIFYQQEKDADSVIAGIQFNFSLKNLLKEDWKLTDIDFAKSYVALNYTNSEGSKVLDTQTLQYAARQTYILPASLDYETGMYYITVHVYQKGSDVPAAYQSLNIVLDATKIQNAGLWEYRVSPYFKWTNRDIIQKGEDAPLENVGISISDAQEIGRDNVFAYYTAGATYVSIFLQCDQRIETYEGVEIGEVEGFRLWNSLSEVDLTLDNFEKTSDSVEEGYAENHYFLGVELYDETESIKNAGFVINHQDLPVVSGVNNFYYQVKLANGTVSEIKQFTIMVSDITPNLEISVDSYVESLKSSVIEGQTSVSSITMKVDEAFSMNAGGDVIVYLQNPYGDVDLAIGETFTLDRNIHNTYSHDSDLDLSNVAFLAMDEYGGVMAVVPQLGAEQRVENPNDRYNITYTEDITEDLCVEYNVPVKDKDGNILYYETKDYNTGEVYYINYADLEYNKFAIDDIAWEIALFNYYSYANKGAYVESHLSIRNDLPEEAKLSELVDYDSITFTFCDTSCEAECDGQGHTYPIGNYAETNAAGYMGAKIDEYTGDIIVYIANKVDQNVEDELLTYRVNYKDIYGKKYTGYAGYKFYMTDSNVSGEYFSDSGIGLNLHAAIAGGIDAQHYNSYADKYYGYIGTGLFAKGSQYTGQFTDVFGVKHDIDYTIQYQGWDYDVDVTFSDTEPTLEDVTVTITSQEALPITVKESEEITILGEGNGSSSRIQVVANQNTTIIFTVGDSEEYRIAVDNIVEFHPTIQWDFDEEQILTDKNGVKYLNGPVTAYVIDEELDVLDRYTGFAPSYTFYPGEETTYTFKGNDYYAVLGTETLKGVDLLIKLPVELRNETFVVEDPEISTGDVDAPAVQLRAYAQRNGLYQNENKALQVEPGIYRNALNNYAEDTLFECFENRADTTAFLGAIGWAATYRFQIELVDDSDVKLFVKKGIFTSAPNYAVGGSDSISGVKLDGRVLEITNNAEFTLFAVDENGNATAIPFNVTNVGEAPIPQVKTVYAGTTAYVYVLPPAVDPSEIADFKLTGPEGVDIEDEAGNDYYGYWYMTYDENGTYNLNYSYTYNEEDVVGTLEVVVDEIDAVGIFGEKIQWSANKLKLATKQDVTVQLTFNKNVEKVMVPDGYEDLVNVLITGNRVTVRYQQDVCYAEDEDGRLPLTAIAYNGTEATIWLDKVDNIDKTAPVVTGPNLILAENGKSITATFITDEKALFRELNNYGTEADNGYEHIMTITENGEYTYSFIDEAGNIKEVTFTVNTIVDTPLKLWFNTSASENGAVEDPECFKLKIGESIYVKANRACEASLNDGEAKSLVADTWVAFTITDNEAGLWPVIYAVDTYGNTASALLNGVTPLDKEAPVIIIKKDQVIAKVGVDRNTVLAMLEENIRVSDTDTDVDVSIQFTEDLMKEGVTAVTYTATDSSNNTSTETCWLKLTAVSEPDVMVNGELVGRDSVYLGSLEDELSLTVDTDGEPYSVVYKKGVLTTAQMKAGATTLIRDVESVTEIDLPLEEAGYYTICIRTQSHDEYLFIIYVE